MENFSRLAEGFAGDEGGTRRLSIRCCSLRWERATERAIPASAARREAWARPITSKAAGSRADRLREPSCALASRGRARMLWMPRPMARGAKSEPAEVTGQVGRVEGEPVADGVEARALTRLELQVVYFDDHRIRECRSADHVAFDEEQPGVVAPLTVLRPLHHAGQGGRDAARRKEGSSDGRGN